MFLLLPESQIYSILVSPPRHGFSLFMNVSPLLLMWVWSAFDSACFWLPMSRFTTLLFRRVGGKSIFSPTNYLHSEGFLLYIRYTHTRPLYVEAFVDHYQIKRILIESGAGFNICTLSTARQLNFDPSLLLTTAVCAYDGTTRTAQGIVRLNWTLGPLVRSTLFYVADIL